MSVVVAMVAVAAVSAVAQYYQSEKARGANEKRLNELKATFDALVPPDFDYTIMDPPELLATVEIPEMDYSKITPEQYKIIGKYVPEVAPYIAEKNPKLLKLTGDAKKGRKAQMDALLQMVEVAKSGRDPMLDAALDDASKNAQVAAQSRTQSLLQDEQRRGTMGSGRGFAAKMIGNADAMGRAAKSSRDAALQSYQAKLGALRDSSQMGANIERNDMTMQSSNNSVLNSFNERSSKRYQDYLNAKADIENSAQMQNLKTEQSISDANVSQNNNSKVRERDRGDSLTKWKYGEDMNQQAIENDNAKWTYGAEVSERDNQNNLKQGRFDNDYKKAGGQSDITKQYNANTSQGAADTNKAIGGVADGVTSGILYANRDDDDDKKKKDKDGRPIY